MTTEPPVTRRRRARRPRTHALALVAVVTVAGALLAGTADPAGSDPRDGAAHTTSDPASHGRIPPGGRVKATTPPAAPRIQLLRAVTRETLPHDPRAFTQGLEFRGATLYESTGRVGESSLRAGPPGKPPTRYVELPAPLFGEGITLTGSTLWQLTWRNGIAIERDPTTLAERRRVGYQGEGWGLCHQRHAGRERLVMSDGTDRLTFRDPDTFTVTGGINVHQDGRPVTRLNELECTSDGSVYANVYPTDTILRIDPDTGTVTANIEATGLLTASERRGARQLNGIAAVPGTDTFLITGKLWPHMFQVTFVPR
ncbi:MULTISPECIES: glutaminyl-peptide cyclotransferase [Streptomyces]|uniref:Glutaminyl-peptide cyclotransferase n=1 Tax=Streptomyces venezuelae TaxID=54571 RepID=A0A5P2ALN1_STRVZ|nr:glutaminyl-peptide cyclotransferase [Streptomyces venezuelae]QES17791.1 glutaminyl-peptide cyclotransferase [Streptomyces venezuelae]